MKRCIGLDYIYFLFTNIYSILIQIGSCPWMLCVLSPTIWGRDCSYCLMKVISHPPLFHCNCVLQLSTGLLRVPIMAGHKGHGTMLVARRAQQNLSTELHWNKEDENHLHDDDDDIITITATVNNIRNHNHTKLSIVEHQQQQREYVSHHHLIVHHTHELV